MTKTLEERRASADTAVGTTTPQLPHSRSTSTLADPHVLTEKGLSKESSDAPVVEEEQYITGVKLLLLLVALFLCTFLVGLDLTVVAAALPTIANQFSALQDVGWYGSAYLLTGTAFQPIFGRAYAYFSLKWTFLLCVVVFTVGSIVCGAAKNSTAFIVGRAVAGLGFGGLYVGVLAIITASVPLQKQANLTSVMGTFYGIGATVGPLIGGALTSSSAGWRWVFYLNVPITGLAIVLCVLFLNPPPRKQELAALARLRRLDWPGAVLIVSAVVCLLLALQDGGVKKPWSSAQIYGLIIGFGLIMITFFISQYFMREDASINLRVLKNRSLLFSSLLNVTLGTVYFTLMYFVPIYFQAVRGSSAIHSGVQTLPLICAIIISMIISGIIVTKTGYFQPTMLGGVALASIGAGLLSMLQPDTSTGRYVGYQILAGWGVGTAAMAPFVGSQIVLPPADRAAGATIAITAQIFGATVFVATAEAIYQNKLLNGVLAIPGLDTQAVLGSGLSAFRETVPAELLPAVIQVANDALQKVFLAAAIISAVGVFMGLPVEWIRMAPGEKPVAAAA